MSTSDEYIFNQIKDSMTDVDSTHQFIEVLGSFSTFQDIEEVLAQILVDNQVSTKVIIHFFGLYKMNIL